MLKKGSKVKYIGTDTSALVVGNIYEVAEVFKDGGIRVYIKTGFAGMTDDVFEVVE